MAQHTAPLRRMHGPGAWDGARSGGWTSQRVVGDGVRGALGGGPLGATAPGGGGHGSDMRLHVPSMSGPRRASATHVRSGWVHPRQMSGRDVGTLEMAVCGGHGAGMGTGDRTFVADAWCSGRGGPRSGRTWQWVVGGGFGWASVVDANDQGVVWWRVSGSVGPVAVLGVRVSGKGSVAGLVGASVVDANDQGVVWWRASGSVGPVAVLGVRVSGKGSVAGLVGASVVDANDQGVVWWRASGSVGPVAVLGVRVSRKGSVGGWARFDGCDGGIVVCVEGVPGGDSVSPPVPPRDGETLSLFC